MQPDWTDIYLNLDDLGNDLNIAVKIKAQREIQKQLDAGNSVWLQGETDTVLITPVTKHDRGTDSSIKFLTVQVWNNTTVMDELAKLLQVGVFKV